MAKLLRINLFLFCLIFIINIHLMATHIVGGELYYECLGNNNYRLTLKIYRDCNNGQAPYDDPANISVFAPNGTHLIDLSLPFPGSTNVPFVATNPCFQAPPNVCVEEAVYQTVVTLPFNPAGLVLAYQRCCRNNSIINIVDPGGTGSTYTETIPAVALATCNNSPRFDNFPPIALCIGDSLVFDHSATDPDGDSLVYSICASNSGASAANPMPAPTSPPPFAPIVFAPPFSATNPISSNPQISINPFTGILKVNPTQQGQFVVGVCAREYRNGVLIGTHTRDFQFNVTVCQSNVNAQFNFPVSLFVNTQGQYVSCGGFTINFQNQSQNAGLYYWNFGDPSTLTDTSTLQNPSYTYSSPGSYQIMLIANPGYFCADTTYQTLVVTPPIAPTYSAPDFKCIDDNSFDFSGSGTFSPGATFLWNFGSNASPTSANTLNVSGVSFDSFGTFPVSLTISDLGCSQSFWDTVTVYGPMTVDWFIDIAEGCVPLIVKFSDSSNTTNIPVQYLWTFGDGTSSTQQNPLYKYNIPGLFDVSLTITDPTGCNAPQTLLRPDWILVHPKPQAGFSFDPNFVSVFLAKIKFTDESVDGVQCIYNLGDETIVEQCDFTHEYFEGGEYLVSQIVINGFGCSDTAERIVTILPEFTFYIPNTFTPQGDLINEYFTPMGVGIDSFQLRIYNRWGENIFTSNDKKYYWNGSRNNSGPLVPQGVYVYMVYIIDVFGREHVFRGNVNLIR